MIAPLLELLITPVTAASFPTALLDADPQLDLATLFERGEASVGGKRLLYFTALTLAVGEVTGHGSALTQRIRTFLDGEGLGSLYESFRHDVLARDALQFREEGFSFKGSFQALVAALPRKRGREAWGEALVVQRDKDVEEIFRRMFAQGQRQIITKLLNKKPLTKTERETFSRVIKKRLLAILDPEVQRVAQVLTGPSSRKARSNSADLTLVSKARRG
ncbi:MAG: hypothetical protein AB7F75_02430 [Planctomycetota bacterium]